MEIVQAILDDLAKFCGACRAVDDVTFVVIKALAVAGGSAAPPSPVTVS